MAIRFILNNSEVVTDLPPGTVLLDYIRYHNHLYGTKIGCREGDCGACTVLIGELKNGDLTYQSMTSCLLPIGNAQSKHVVTIEGINMEGLNPMQQAMADEGATQCGFCTPGFVMSLAGFCLSDKEPHSQNAIAAVDGNICRCTGYKSIERAANKVAALLQPRNAETPVQFACDHKILPSYFSTIKERLATFAKASAAEAKTNGFPAPNPRLQTFLGGGTDLYVQKHDEMTHSSIGFLFDTPALNGIQKEGNRCLIGPSATVSDLRQSSIIQDAFPGFQQYAKLVSSTPIRNMATIAGNFVNASPIGDFTIFFLALDAQLVLQNGDRQRTLPLRKFYTGYKQLAKQPEEHIAQIQFELPGKTSLFHFEKVSKRTHLDIASVNSAIHLTMDGHSISNAGLSAGGVGPVPLFLQKTSAFLNGKTITEELIEQAIEIAQTEISPISDARGTADYKRLLLTQLIKAHFITLFPTLEINKLIPA
jgi:xanthine dehydrogenase small subunit